MKWTPEQGAKIRERAHKHGISSALKHVSGEYPNLKKQTVFEFKKAYEKLKSYQQDATKIDSRKTWTTKTSAGRSYEENYRNSAVSLTERGTNKFVRY